MMEPNESVSEKQQVNETDTLPDEKRSIVPIKRDTREDKIMWSPDNEKILVEWCDIAQCYKWLNQRCHAKLSTMHAWFTIPAITLSTVTGTASFAQSTLPPSVKDYAPAVIGTINIMIGILTTIQQYLKISENNEAHRVASIAWDKFARNIRIELAKKPEERDKAGHFIKSCRLEFDRLMETSPSIDEKTILEFTLKFQGKPGSLNRSRFERLKKPDICDTIISADETRNKWYEDGDNLLNSSELDEVGANAVRERDELIMKQQHIMDEREEELAKQVEIKRQTELLKIQEVEMTARRIRDEEDAYHLHIEKIIEYINGYQEVYNRKPLKEDIMTNFKDNVNIDVLDKFIQGYMH
jgi:hypothetical protein